MGSLETLLTQVQALSGTTEDLVQLQGLLKQTEDTFSKSPSQLNDFLGALDPARHSLAWLYVLDVQAVPTGKDEADLVIKNISTLLISCSAEQVRLAPEKFNAVCRKFKDTLVQRKEYMRGILPLKSAIRKLQPTSEHLTIQHADFFQLCLLAKCYRAAVSVLEDDIFEVDPKNTGICPRDFLLFCYYGGMLLIGLKRFQKALEFFSYAITAPSLVLNAITVACYKKFILVSLIVTGQLAPLPKYAPSVAQRNLKSCCPEYVELSNTYASRDMDDLKRCLASREETFKADNNLGLAKQVVTSLYNRSIQRLTQTYLTLSLHDIASSVKLGSAKDAELHVLRMIEDGDIHATINQKDGMVSFVEDPEQYNSQDMAERLNADIQRTILLANRVIAMDEHISSDRTYLNKISSRERPEDFEWGPQKMFDSI
eukprot:jgi/Mesen1/3985/ME000210S03225